MLRLHLNAMVHWVALTSAVCATAPLVVRAQNVPPFYAAGGSSFTPEIGVINSGVINDVQAVVSPDQKHVTLNMRASNSKLLALEEFTFQNGGSALGFVGSSGGAGANAAIRGAGRRGKASNPNADYPDGLPTPHSILDETGMFRVDLLNK